MRSLNSTITKNKVVILMTTAALTLIPGAFAQAPLYPPDELERLVSRIALYPDPLLAQVFAASTFPGEIPDAARWADQHHYITGDALAATIAEDRLPWDPSVQALLPFPSVLDMMARDPGWTNAIGSAFLSQREDVMEAVQTLRAKAKDAGDHGKAQRRSDRQRPCLRNAHVIPLVQAFRLRASCVKTSVAMFLFITYRKICILI